MASKELKGVHKYAEFGAEAIRARVKKMTDLRDGLDASNLHVRISYENRKTTAVVPSVSLIPIAYCGNCNNCSRGCYDIRNVCYLPSVQKSRAINAAILEQDRDRYFAEVEAHVKFQRFFRVHIGGDFVDFDYLRRFVTIAERNPQCQILAFTKMYSLVNTLYTMRGGLPNNLHIIFSDWKGQKMDNRHNLPVSSPVWADGTTGPNVTENRFLCPGNCSDCAETDTGCWAAKPGDTILFEAH